MRVVVVVLGASAALAGCTKKTYFPVVTEQQIAWGPRWTLDGTRTEQSEIGIGRPDDVVTDFEVSSDGTRIAPIAFASRRTQTTTISRCGVAVARDR